MASKQVNAAAGVVAKLAKTVELLESWGVSVDLREGWESNQARGDIQFKPDCVLDHHTGGDGTSLKMLFDDGNGVVPAPLCNFAVLRTGLVVLGAGGYANHSGFGNKAAGELIRKGPPLDRQMTPGPTQQYSLNRYAVGIEVQAAAKWTAEQYAATVALNAALTITFGWNKDKPPIGGHKEFTRRKPDPVENMASIRRATVALIKEKEAEPPKPPEPEPEPPDYDLPPRPAGRRPLLKEGSKGVWTKYLQECLLIVEPVIAKPIKDSGGADGVFGPGTEKSVMGIQKKLKLTVDGIVGPKTWDALHDTYGIG